MDPKKRISAKEALGHPWFQGISDIQRRMSIQRTKSRNSTTNLGFEFSGDMATSTDNLMKQQTLKSGSEKQLDRTVILQMRTFSKNTSFLKKAALNYLVKTLKESDIEHLKSQFELMDVDHTGIIEIDELTEAIHELKLDFSKEEIDKIINSITFKGNGEINYTEFIAATISAKKLLTDQRLYALFKEFDHQNIDVLTTDNIQQAMIRMGKELSSSEIEKLMQEVKELTGNIGKIDFKQF